MPKNVVIGGPGDDIVGGAGHYVKKGIGKDEMVGPADLNVISPAIGSGSEEADNVIIEESEVDKSEEESEEAESAAH